MRSSLTFLLAVLVVFVRPNQAQAPPAGPSCSAASSDQNCKPAAAADVSSPDAILAALYDVISGPAGQKRDWNRFRSLFAPGARLIPVGPHPATAGGGIGARVLDPEGYITASSERLERDGFFEKETARRTERFANLLHAWSTYEGRRKPDDPQPFLRGINSIQLFFDGSRWWILSVTWHAESPSNPLPPEYLPASGL